MRCAFGFELLRYLTLICGRTPTIQGIFRGLNQIEAVVNSSSLRLNVNCHAYLETKVFSAIFRDFNAST